MTLRRPVHLWDSTELKSQSRVSFFSLSVILICANSLLSSYSLYVPIEAAEMTPDIYAWLIVHGRDLAAPLLLVVILSLFSVP